MGFTFQLPAIVGGTVLVIERIESQNYQSGVFGWAIFANGDAEFNDVTARGELLVGTNPGRHIRAYIDTTFPLDPTPTLEFSTGSTFEALPATITTGGPLSIATITMGIQGPKHTGGNQPSIGLSSHNTGSSELDLFADIITVSSPAKLDTIWSTPVFLNGWVDVAGSRVNYFQDASGDVRIRGQLQNGVAVTMFNLPAPYRPTQSVQFVMRSAVAAGNYSVIQVQTNGDVVVLTNFAMAQIACRLDLSFSTL